MYSARAALVMYSVQTFACAPMTCAASAAVNESGTGSKA